MYIIISIALAALISGAYALHHYYVVRRQHSNQLWNTRMDAWAKDRMIREQRKEIESLKRKLHDHDDR